MRLYYQIRILFRVNILLGIYHRLRRKSLKKRGYSELPVSEMIDQSQIARNFIAQSGFFDDPDRKAQLLATATNFTNGLVNIYGNTVALDEYTIDKFHFNRTRSELHNREIRFQWEIYRGRFLFNIGLAYQLTKDENYASSLTEYLKDWKAYSPATNPKMRYNGMESALRLMNLALLDPLLKDSEHYTPEIRNELIVALIFHADYTYRNYDITWYGLESNHGLSCAVGLVYASLLFPEHPNSTKWHNLGIRALKRAMKNQFSADGVNFESSVNYHRFVFELLIFLLSVFYRQNLQIDPSLEDSIRRIGNSLCSLTHSNQMISRFGDSDGGKFLPDFNTLPDFNSLEYLQWFKGQSNAEFFETIMFSDIPEMRGFLTNGSDAGRASDYVYFKDRSLSLIICGNEIGTHGKGNHQHNDFLSFELYGKCPFIVDPWSYCYTGDPTLRNSDRATERHNTVQINGIEMVEFDKSRIFEMMKNIDVSIQDISSSDSDWSVSMSHSGYRSLKNGRQFHQRNFRYERSQRVLTIIDELSGKGSHEAVLNYHIQKMGWQLNIADDKYIFTNEYETFEMSNDQGRFNVKEGYVSQAFMNREPSYHLNLGLSFTEQVRIITTIRYLVN